MKTVCVFGAASDRIPEGIRQDAYDLGAMIAKNGWGIIYGGGSTGCMGAVSNGAVGNGGEVIGVVPAFFRRIELEDTSENCTHLITTSDMADRKKVMEENCDAFVVCFGGYGTADELFEVTALKQLKQHTKPIIVFNSHDCYQSLKGYVQSLREAKAAPTKELMTFCDTIEEIEEILLKEQ